MDHARSMCCFMLTHSSRLYMSHRWCILAPLHYASPSNNTDSATSDHNPLESPFYSRLHLALLESLLDCYTPSSGLHHMAASDSGNIISAQHLAVIVEPITRWLKELNRMEDEAARCRGETAMQLALDRFAQVIQVALVTNCVYGNMRK